ncbi:LCP family protein [Modestobacter sp. SYSU DS0511]
MLRNILSSDLLFNPGKQKAIVEQVGSSVTFDQGLDVFDLAAQMQNVQPGNITFQTIPGLDDARIDGADVLEPPSQEVLNEFFASLNAAPAEEPPSPAPTSAAPSVSPSSVTVSVLNGSGVSGAAATTAEALVGAGFGADNGGNADATATTTVSHRAGDEAAAALVAAQLPGVAVTVDDSLPAGTLRLVIGTDFNGIGEAVTAPAPAAAPGGYATTERTAADSSCIN